MPSTLNQGDGGGSWRPPAAPHPRDVEHHPQEPRFPLRIAAESFIQSNSSAPFLPSNRPASRAAMKRILLEHCAWLRRRLLRPRPRSRRPLEGNGRTRSGSVIVSVDRAAAMPIAAPISWASAKKARQGRGSRAASRVHRATSARRRPAPTRAVPIDPKRNITRPATDPAARSGHDGREGLRGAARMLCKEQRWTRVSSSSDQVRADTRRQAPPPEARPFRRPNSGRR